MKNHDQHQFDHDINLVASELAEAAIKSGYLPVGFGRKEGVIWFGLGGTDEKYRDLWQFPIDNPGIISGMRCLKKNLTKHINRAKKADLQGGES